MGLAPAMMVIFGLTLVIGYRHSKDNMGLLSDIAQPSRAGIEEK